MSLNMLKPLKKTGPRKKKDGEGVFDIEQQFIMRLPPGPAAALKQEVKTGSMHLKDRLSIEMQPDQRRGAIRYGNEYYLAKMVDLPCITECHKTVDMKTFYKAADVSQMLITTTEEDLMNDENESPKKKEKDKKYQYNHGITAPLKNVRKRRFRKTLKKKYMEQPDIEKEVKRLFRTDAEAISVKWELITEDEKPAGESGDGGPSGSQAGGIEGFMRTDTGASLDIDIFGELSTSDEEDEKDVNIVDSEEDISRQPSYVNLDTLAADSQLEPADSSTDGAQQELSDDSSEMQSHLSELGRQLEHITQEMKDQADSDEINTSVLKLEDNT